MFTCVSNNTLPWDAPTICTIANKTVDHVKPHQPGIYVLKFVAVHCSVSQCVAVCCSRPPAWNLCAQATRFSDARRQCVSTVSATSATSWHVVRKKQRTMLAVLVSFTVKGLAPTIVSRVICLVMDILGRETQCMAGSKILRYFACHVHVCSRATQLDPRTNQE